jgi:hypothetical protein
MRDSRLLVSALSCTFVAALVAACSGGSTDNSNGGGGGGTDTDAGVITTPTVDGGNCGHNSTPCPTGAKCKTTPDCIKGDVCTGGVCNVPPASCSDGSKDGDETDVDCGGSCTPCADGKTCSAPTDCIDAVCTGTCQGPSCTDKLLNGGETGVDCGGPTCPKCTTGGGCKTAADCDSAVCGKDNLCAAPTSMDGVKNGTETDTDCGGGAPTNAPTCAVGKKCGAGADCFWGHCNAGVCGDHVPGTKDGDETDIDCGGTKSPACDWYKSCLVDKDCTSTACDTSKKCAVGPSCKAQVHGGKTCGTGEVGDGNEVHETCCKSLPVNGYTDPIVGAGKKVYVDKYEITAGRMRAFIDYVSGLNAGVPAIRTYTAAHRPSRWNNGWEEALPDANFGSAQAYTIKNPTVNLLYPGQDQFLINKPTQSGNGWWVGDSGGAYGAGSSHDFNVDNGVYFALGSNSNFPEYYATKPPWPSNDYSVYHSQNCSNQDGSYGLSTYWFPQAIVNTYSGPSPHGKYFTQDQLDEKTLNCTPNALFAAFCAWDGGQLATAEVMDAITGNTVSPVYDGASQNGKYAPGNSACGPGGNSFISYSDGAGVACFAYFYPNDMGNTWDGTSRIAPPGRLPNDLINKAGDPAGTEPWMDMIGNMQEAVLKKAETARFDYRGYGTEYGSITHHRNQQTTPRFKSGAFGARCMRFK